MALCSKLPSATLQTNTATATNSITRLVNDMGGRVFFCDAVAEFDEIWAFGDELLGVIRQRRLDFIAHATHGMDKFLAKIIVDFAA